MIPDDARAALPSALTVIVAVIPPLFIGMIDQTIVSTALPAIGREFGNLGEVGLVITAYLAATAISAPVYGRLGDAWGRRRMLALALGLTCIGSLACALSQNFWMLIGARVLQGLGGGGLIGLSQALLGQFIAPRKRAEYQGFLAGAAICASTLGPVFGGMIAAHLGWRWIFALNPPLTLIALLTVFRLPPRRTPRRAVHFDWLGLVAFGFLTLTVIAFFDTVRAQQVSVLLGAGAVGALVLLVAQERRNPHPLLAGELLGNRSITLSLLLAMCHGALFVSVLTLVPVYLAFCRGLTTDRIGLLMLPVSVGIGIGAFLTGKAIRYTGRTTVYPALGAMAAAAVLAVIAWGLPGAGLWTVSLGFALVSACIGTVMGVVQITVQVEAAPATLGSATSTVMLARSFGAVVGTAMASIALARGTMAVTPAGAEAVFAGAFAVTAVLALGIGAIAALIPRRGLPDAG